MSDINITVNDEIVNIDVLDTPVLVEVSNAPGPAGAGVAVGGTTGQVLAKASDANYDTEWVDVSGGVWGTITGTLSNQTDLQNALNAKVPYSGATQDVSLGEYGINVGNVIYDTTPTGIPTEQGATYWDADAETVALIMNGTIQKVGEDTFYHVRNTTGSTIAKGTAVRFSGTTGNSGRLLIAPMLADGTYPSQYYMGITSEAIANNADGKVYHFGKMRNINTFAFADGDVLYVSPSVAGALTATAPVAPNNIIVAAAVVHAANNGTLMIRTTLGSNINADEGVLLTTPTANQGLFYDSGLWVNKSITTALGYTPANAATTLTINGVTYDLSTSRSWTIAAGISGSGASGQVTYWTGASAVSGSNNLFWDNANGRLGIGTNAPEFITDIKSAAFPYLQIKSTTDTQSSNGRAGIRLARGSSSTLTGFDFVKNDLDNLEIRSLSFGSATTFATLFRSTANLVLQNGGTFSDGGQRLQVYGNTLLRGSGATSATTALTVQNSSSTNIFVVRNDGNVGIGTNAPTNPLTVIGNAFFGGANPAIFMNGSAINQTALISNANGNIASLVLRCAQIKFEDGNSVQKLLLSTTGNLLLQNGGTFTDNGQRLQVYGDTLLRGSGATSATTALTVQNSSSTNLFSVRNDGFVSAPIDLSVGGRLNVQNGIWIDFGGGTFTRKIFGQSGLNIDFKLASDSAIFNFLSFVSPFSMFSIGTTGLISGVNFGFAQASPTALADIGASTTTRASLRIRSGTAPTSPNDGDIWFDGTDIKMRIGGVTKTFTLI